MRPVTLSRPGRVTGGEVPHRGGLGRVGAKRGQSPMELGLRILNNRIKKKKKVARPAGRRRPQLLAI